jgi:hypothetical protein
MTSNIGDNFAAFVRRALSDKTLPELYEDFLKSQEKNMHPANMQTTPNTATLADSEGKGSNIPEPSPQEFDHAAAYAKRVWSDRLGREIPGAEPRPPEGHPGYLDLLDEMRELHLQKGNDYGQPGLRLANLYGAVDLGIEPWRGALLRARDKWHRILAWANGKKLVCESVEDSLKDLAAYALLTLTLLREEQEQMKALEDRAAQARERAQKEMAVNTEVHIDKEAFLKP